MSFDCDGFLFRSFQANEVVYADRRWDRNLVLNHPDGEGLQKRGGGSLRLEGTYRIDARASDTPKWFPIAKPTCVNR